MRFRSAPAAVISLIVLGDLAMPASPASQPDGSSDVGPVSSQSVEERAPDLKSGTTALLLSLLGTVVPAAASAKSAFGQSEYGGDNAAIVFLGALVVGPSLGHFYAERPGRAVVGMGLRVVALAGIAGAVAASLSGGDSGAEALGLLGLALGGGVLAIDIVTAPHSAHVHNEKILRSNAEVGITSQHGLSSFRLGISASF